MAELKFSTPIKGFVKNNGIICGNCKISFETVKSLRMHWTSKNCAYTCCN